MTTPTPQQQHLIEGIADATAPNIIGMARAGTGKTATLVMASKVVDPSLSVIACAFNTIIAKEMEKKLPKHWLSKTTNSLGFTGVRKRFDRKLEVKAFKVNDIIRDIGDHAEGFPDLKRAVGMLKAWGVVPRGALAEPRSLCPDAPNVYLEIFNNFNIDVGDHPDPIGLCRQVLLTNIQQAWKGCIDFDDQLYLAYIYKCPVPMADLVLVDEAQDINPVQRAMLNMMVKPGGRLIAIGDDRQAIYGFRGADRMSLAHIQVEFGAQTRPLTTCFRCSKLVIAEAQLDVPDIMPWESAPIGEVKHLKELVLTDIPRGSAILCRNNAPLMSACIRLIKSGVGAVMLGREIASGLIQLIDKQKAGSIGELIGRLAEDVEHRKGLLIQRNKHAQAELLQDKADCIEYLAIALGKTKTVNDLKTKLKAMFSDDEGVVTLSTIHKAKGREWPTVYFLDPGLIPSKYAKTAAEQEQEFNLRYVARTRAQHTLCYINSEDLK